MLNIRNSNTNNSNNNTNNINDNDNDNDKNNKLSTKHTEYAFSFINQHMTARSPI